MLSIQVISNQCPPVPEPPVFLLPDHLVPREVDDPVPGPVGGPDDLPEKGVGASPVVQQDGVGPEQQEEENNHCVLQGQSK